MTTAFEKALRKLKPERRKKQFAPETGSALVTTGALAGSRLALVPDTNVYIRNAAGKLAPDVADLLDMSLQFHCAVCLGEIAIGVSAFHPAASGYEASRDHYERLMRAIPDNRILTPDDDIWLEAGIVAGTLARTQGLLRDKRKELLNDALIYLTAAKAGIPVLTDNSADFSLIQQVVGSGNFISYGSVTP